MTMGDDDPRGVANLNPWGIIGRINVEYYLTLLKTKYTFFRPCGFRKEDFKCFPIISLWQIMTPPGRGQFGPQGHDWQELLRGFLNCYIASHKI